MARSKPRSGTPTWIKLWLGFSGILVIYDAGYVLMRPRSMPGGDLYLIWQPYVLYAKVDKLYSGEAMAAGDGFNKGQAMMNLVEVCLHYMSLYKLSDAKTARSGELLAFSSQLMTLWKTVLYWLNDLCRPAGHRYSEGSDTLTWALVYLLPNSFWLIFPTLAVWTLWGRILAAMNTGRKES